MMAAQPQEVPAAVAQGKATMQAAAAQADREIMEAMEAGTQPAAVAAEQEQQEQVQAVITEEPEETGFNMIYQELTLFTPVVVAAVARTAAPAEQVAPAAAAMAEITEEESEEVMESRIQAAAAAERGHLL
jgi:hypothetical protein